MSNTIMKRKLLAKKPFEFSARVTLQLGRESISSSTVAISELIKNSYDADANNITLDFHLREHATSTLIIEDDGYGMDAETLIGHWLKIGTDNKSLRERSLTKGRVLTGAKGLGRLGIDRLCKKLVLYTKTKEMNTAVQLNLDWKQFENTTRSLSEIEHEIYEVELPIKDKYGEVFLDENSSGTRMVLIGLKDKWDDKFLDVLENELRLLSSPFQAENEFSITLKTNSKGERNEKTLNSEKVLNAARWKVKASVDGNGLVSICYTNNKKQLDIKQESLPWGLWLKNSGEKPLFGPLEFEFYYFVQDTTDLNKLNLKIKDLKKFMRLNNGVRIYRDHFRVRPYGEPTGKGDWLDLGLRKAASPGGVSQQGWRIGPNQIVGSIVTSREINTALDDQANREGLVENEAFFQLRTFVLKTIETFEVLVQKDTTGNRKTDLSDELAAILIKNNDKVEKIIEDLKKSVSKTNRKSKSKKKKISTAQLVANRLNELETLRTKQAEAEVRYLEALQTEKEQLKDQKNTLSNLASIGILTISFGHEVRQHTGLAFNGASRSLSHLKSLDNKDGLLNKPIKFTKIVKNSTLYVDNFSRFALENIKPDKRTQKKIGIPAVFEYVFNMFATTLEKMQIKPRVRLLTDNAKYEVFAYEIDWESIVINFMTNSIWAIENESDANKLRKIEVEISETELELLVTYKDSGIGLEQGTEESIFLPMQSGKRDKIGNSIGTGMGLAIVKNHIEDHMKGTIKAIAHSDIGGAEFQIKIPKSERK
jgi:signal transduction histidine kinase/anti-sigma regulatory factor (Ser/Thr protein kinase)